MPSYARAATISLPGCDAARRWALMKVEAAESSSSGWAIWSFSSPPKAMLTLAWPYSTSARLACGPSVCSLYAASNWVAALAGSSVPSW